MRRWDVTRFGQWGAVFLAALMALNESHVWHYGLRGIVAGLLILAAAAGMGFMLGAAVAVLRNFVLRRSLVD